ELKLKLEKFQTSSKNLSQLLASQTNNKIRLGYNNQVFTSSMFDCDELFSFETDESLPASLIYDRYQLVEGYHAVPPPYIGTFMPPKPNLVFYDAPNVNETVHTAFNVVLSPTKPNKDLSHIHRPSAPIIEYWVSDSEDDSKAELPQNVLSFVHPTEQVKPPRPSVMPKMAQTPARNHAQRGNPQHYARITLPNPQRHVVPTTVLTKSKLVPLNVARQVTTAVLQPHVTRPRPSKTVVIKSHSPLRRNINRRPSPKPSNFPPKVTTVKVSQVNDIKGVQGKWEWKPKCPILDHDSRHTSASLALKRFDYNDSLGRSKSVMAWVPKRH
nr:hypothetical protein [Tanacetum cinerariifolium]